MVSHEFCGLLKYKFLFIWGSLIEIAEFSVNCLMLISFVFWFCWNGINSIIFLFDNFLLGLMAFKLDPPIWTFLKSEFCTLIFALAVYGCFSTINYSYDNLFCYYSKYSFWVNSVWSFSKSIVSALCCLSGDVGEVVAGEGSVNIYLVGRTTLSFTFF